MADCFGQRKNSEIQVTQKILAESLLLLVLAPCNSSSDENMERNRRGVRSISSAARWFPRCNQMKMSVSNSTVSRLAQFLHHLFDGFFCFSATAEKGMASCRHAARTFLRNKPSSHFASLHNQHLFSSAQRLQDILHPVSKIDDRRFHVYEKYTLI